MSKVDQRKGEDMRSRLTKAAAALTLVAALAVGGATFASASSKAPAAPVKAKAPAAAAKAPAGVVDNDTLQEGDQTTPDTPGAGEQESPSSSESSSESAGESGSEVPGNDGPGGHADEPGNPSADHQFEGAE
jgi:hypothetical protein